MRCKLVVIADDLTGANDTGVQFIQNRQKVFVTSQLNTDSLEQELLKNDILVINTESRFLSSKEAYNRLFNLGLFLKSRKIESIYKKIDSTYRGNISAEINGLKRGLELEKVFIASAFPKVGRKVINGNILVNDELLEESIFSKDPKNPIKKSFIPHILEIDNYSIIKDLNINLNEINSEFIIFDSSSDQELEKISKALEGYTTKNLVVGTGGLAQYIKINFNKKINLLVSGSANDITHSQISKILNSNCIVAYVIDIERVKEIENNIEFEIIESFEKALNENKDFFLYLKEVSKRDIDANIVYENSGILIDFLKKMSSILLKKYNININNIFITGGDTAMSILEFNGINGINIIGEIEPGIPYGKVLYNENEYLIATKAGGFGQAYSLINILDFFRGDKKYAK